MEGAPRLEPKAIKRELPFNIDLGHTNSVDGVVELWEGGLWEVAEPFSEPLEDDIRNVWVSFRGDEPVRELGQLFVPCGSGIRIFTLPDLMGVFLVSATGANDMLGVRTHLKQG